VFDALVEEIDIDGVRATLDGFLAETEKQLARLRACSCDSDRTGIKEEAHKLKGASGTFGLLQVSELARTLEHSAFQIAPSDYPDMLDRIEACFGMARIELEAAMAESVAQPCRVAREYCSPSKTPALFDHLVARAYNAYNRLC
jgi:HPt (histidine-containing phosphotransfer) domain-containing protein